VDKGDLAVFEESNGALEFEALDDTGFILGSAVKHPHELALACTRFTRASRRSPEAKRKSRKSANASALKGPLAVAKPKIRRGRDDP